VKQVLTGGQIVHALRRAANAETRTTEMEIAGAERRIASHRLDFVDDE
jgi:hypothetical protein